MMISRVSQVVRPVPGQTSSLERVLVNDYEGISRTTFDVCNLVLVEGRWRSTR